MPDHKPIPVKGYSSQSDEKIDIVNRNKELEERVLRLIDDLVARRIVDEPGKHSAFDADEIAFARAQIQNGFMWLNRAIFAPGRVSLPEDREKKTDD